MQKNVSITTACHIAAWDPSFCHPGSNFHRKNIKYPGIVENGFFFSLELELGTYINLYSFELSIE